ncbi:MAG: 16S rRNA processing protein RimM [Armatimonadetes bacterium]|nr:16S rRNA processing protein RimM [Armatimonadota bacterium]
MKKSGNQKAPRRGPAGHRPPAPTPAPPPPPAPPLPGKVASVPVRQLVSIGKILKPHGFRGEMRILVLTDFPERFDETERVYLFRDEAGPARELEVESARLHHGRILLKLCGIESSEAVESVRNFFVAVHEDELVELEEDEYWHFQLEGLEVRDAAGVVLGRLESIVSTPAHDLYLVRTDRGELLIPAISRYVLDIDLEAGVVKVDPPIIED